MRLMSVKDRNNYRCCRCGKMPVKYFVAVSDPFEADRIKERAYCSKCALLIAMTEREHDTFMKDEER